MFGTPAAWFLATRSFRGRELVITLIELPLVLPPAVAGIALRCMKVKSLSRQRAMPGRSVGTMLSRLRKKVVGPADSKSFATL